MSEGLKIAAEIKAAFNEAAAATGEGELLAVIKRPGAGPQNPWDDPDDAGTDKYYLLTAIQDEYRLQDVAGTLVQEVVRIISVDATSVIPLESDKIALTFTDHDYESDDDWLEVQTVLTVAPGGVPLMYELAVQG